MIGGPGRAAAGPGPARSPLSAAQIVVVSFVGLSLVGTVLLSMPFAQQGAPHALIDDMFTATSAACVTGLLTLDAGTRYSPVGLAIIAMLAQIGGLGYMTAATLGLVLVGKRLSMRDRLNLAEATDQPGIAGLRRHVRNIAAMMVGMELLALAVLAIHTVPEFGWAAGLGYAAFFAVVTFTNAGISPFPDGVARWHDDPLVLLTMATMIVLGGLGYNVLRELGNRLMGRPPDRRWAALVAIVVPATAILLVGTTVLVWLLEHANPKTLGPMPLGTQWLNAFFMAVQPRTAGFNSIDTTAMAEGSLLLFIPLMFIGTGPGGTGGGMKITTFAILLATVVASIRGTRDVTLPGLRRRVPDETVHKAVAVLVLSIAVVLGATLAIAALDPHPFHAVLFEVVSAFGTAGLSMGITGALSTPSKLVIVATMLAGRVGPLMLLLAAFPDRHRSAVRYPEEPLMVG